MNGLPQHNTKCLAEQKCTQRGRDFGLLFRNQYVLERASKTKYPFWQKKRIGEWTLHHGEAMRVTPIVDASGHHVGFILGYAISNKFEVIENVLRIPMESSELDFLATVENIIINLSGAYIGIIICDHCERIYTDPVCDIPVLYDMSQDIVASSFGLISTGVKNSDSDFKLRNILSGRQTFSFGRTIDRNVKRIISNHYLNLLDYSLVRYWPIDEKITHAKQEDIPKIVDEIAYRLSSNLEAYINNFECILGLTGGRDSRILLACVMPHIDKLNQIFTYRFHNPSRLDSQIAQKMADSIGFPMKQYFKKDNTLTLLRDMRLKMGWSGFRGEFLALATLEQLPCDTVFLRGNILELLRANQWKQYVITKPLVMRHGIRRLGVGSSRSERENVIYWRDEYQNWYDSLPPKAQEKCYDYGFLEHLLPNTQGAYFNGFHRNPMINPFNDRRIIELTISIPAQDRNDGSAVNLLIQRKDPRLMDYKFI